MANIIYDEKRFLNIGEVCAIYLRNIHPTYLTLDDNFDNIVNFYSEKNGISSDNDITFVKYLGNGFFMDLVSDQLLMTEIYDVDDFGTDEFHLLDTVSQDELTKMKDYWNLIQNPTDAREFKDSFSIFLENPLTISIATSPFMSINSDIAKQFASQSLEKIKAKLLASKLKAQQQIQQQYGELEETIAKYYHNSEVSSTPKNI